MAQVMCTLHADLYPRADCRGTATGDAESNCGRSWPPDPTTLSRAKDHVKHTGHAVLVTRETHSLYEVVVQGTLPKLPTAKQVHDLSAAQAVELARQMNVPEDEQFEGRRDVEGDES